MLPQHTLSQAELDGLVLLAQSGDSEAQSLLCTYLTPAMLRFAYSLCHDKTLSADATQDVWEKSLRTLRRLRDPRAFRSWLLRAVKWRVFDLLRQRGHQAALLNAVEAEVAMESYQETQPDSGILSLIRQLPEQEQQAMELFYQYDLQLAEIALVQEVPVGTVKSRLNRARKRLKNWLT